MSAEGAASKGNNQSLLVFNGRKDKFRVWTQKFVAHLKEMSIAQRRICLSGGSAFDERPEPDIKYEEWLQGEPAESKEADPDKKRWHNLYRDEQQQGIRSLLSKVLPDSFVGQMRDDYTDKEPIHMIWRDLERKYGISNLANVKSNVNKLLKIAQSEFNSVESYLAEMKTLKNVINSNTRKYLKCDVVTDDFIALLALGVLPSEFYAAQISLDEESFSLSDIESKLIGIFGNKSKREIMGNKSGQSGGHKSDVNHVTNKRKAASVESNNGECFYCDGTQNHLTNGNDFRKHMNDKKAKKARKDVKVDMIQSIDRDAGYRESSGEVQLSELDLFNLEPMDDVDSSGYMDMGDASAVDVNQVDSSVISKRLKNLSIKAKHVTSNVDSE
ncbi:hypothetical protein LEN26_017774, partial [Aphanomyces euteiches]